jgi:hypothetical protein
LLAEEIYNLHFMDPQQMQNGGAVLRKNLLMQAEWCHPAIGSSLCCANETGESAFQLHFWTTEYIICNKQHSL